MLCMTKESVSSYRAGSWCRVEEQLEAYLGGDLVEPIKPIVFYIDKQIPTWLYPYVKRAVREPGNRHLNVPVLRMPFWQDQNRPMQRILFFLLIMLAMLIFLIRHLR